MLIVDPKGLFEGERLAACSDAAQLHWQRLFLAANGYACLELSYAAIVSNVYRSFKKPPAEDELWGFFEEYAANFLVILYQVDGIWWAQFACSAKYMPRYKTARDESSPRPPVELLERHRAGYIGWKKAKSIQNQRFQKFTEGSGNVQKISAAVAVVVAVVDAGVVDEQKSSLALTSAEVRAVFEMPLVGGSFFGISQTLHDEYVSAYPAVSVMEQFAAMRVWLISNPTKMKTRSGIKRFMNNWLSKEQNRARPQQSQPSFADTDYRTSYGLPEGENVGLL